MSDEPTIAKTKLETIYGLLDFWCFTWGPHEEDNVLCAGRLPAPSPVLVRVQSACYTAEIFRSLDCDCHEQLHTSLRRVASEGGVLIYMLCDGRGAGLAQKFLGLELGRTSGLDTSDAYAALGLPQDPRTYDRVVTILRYFGIESVRLMTNNPRKVAGLSDSGLTVVREPLEIPPTSHSVSYLRTKKSKMGHLLSGLPPGLEAETPDEG